MLFLPQHVLTRSGFFNVFPYFFPAFAKIFRINLGFSHLLHRKIGPAYRSDRCVIPLYYPRFWQKTKGTLFFFGLFIVKFTLSSQ